MKKMGSKTATGPKLWVKVPLSRNSTAKADQEVKEVRGTVTSLLRHHQIVRKQEQEERARVEGFVQGRSNWEFEAWRDGKQAQDRKQKDAEGAKRLLKSKLAYHKAIAATRQVHHHKQKAADNVRTEGRRLKDQVEEVQEAERERRRLLASDIKEELGESKRLNEQLQMEKRRKAQELKDQTQRLQIEARQKELVDAAKRKERIQRIQASKLALRQSATQSLSPAAFLGALGSPHAEIKQKMSKDARLKELEEKHRKVQDIKEERLHKLSEVAKKLTSHLTQSHAKRELESKFKDISFKHSILEDQELNKLSLELEQLKMYNLKKVPLRKGLD